ncbi:hypothetical protein [Marinicauda pacifica]|uniref:hypothetical protein n=1 Tax=Marinicauda pacifica TaxID=1133559 RepID=UPI0035C7A196
MEKNRKRVSLFILIATLLSLPAIALFVREINQTSDPGFSTGYGATGSMSRLYFGERPERAVWECLEPFACSTVLQLLLNDPVDSERQSGPDSTFSEFQQSLQLSINLHESAQLEEWRLEIEAQVAPSGTLGISSLRLPRMQDGWDGGVRIQGVPEDLAAPLVNELETDVAVQHAIWVALELYSAKRKRLHASASQAVMLQEMDIEASRDALHQELDARYPRVRNRQRAELQRLQRELFTQISGYEESSITNRNSKPHYTRIVFFILLIILFIIGLLLSFIVLLQKEGRSERIWQASIIMVSASIASLYALVIPS